jgi:RNA-directed DNA polymerase
MAKKLPYRILQRSAAQFCKIRHLGHLAELLKTPQYRLQLLAARPQYNIFSIPKKDGSKRWIEDPADELKAVQDRLAFYLGTVYYLHKTAAAYGFIFTVKKEDDPRHIVTNAQQHLGKYYLFNADLEDFFHQVKEARLEKIFAEPPFDFKDKVVDLLVNICTNMGRLPMGAPTSPVLSNLATIELDRELLQLADWAEWRYTRYADDLCFSSVTPFKELEIQRITEIVEAEGYQFNSQKFKRLGPNDRKEITGVQLGKDKVEVPDEFIKKLREELVRLRHVVEVANRMGRREKWIEKYQQQVTGKVNFVEMVLDNKNPIAHEMADLLADANDPPDDFGAQSWLDFGYV